MVREPSTMAVHPPARHAVWLDPRIGTPPHVAQPAQRGEQDPETNSSNDSATLTSGGPGDSPAPARQANMPSNTLARAIRRGQ
jgi:hypothetical protein